MYSSFLQSPEWEKFQQYLGRKTWQVDGELLIQLKLPFDFNYLYSPRPRIENADSFLMQIKVIAREEKTLFLKIDPEMQGKSDFSMEVGLPADPLQPRKTILLDLSKSEEELLAAMHEKTRYNIRLAERHGVFVYQSNDFPTFWNLLRETAQRDGFSTHTRDYYEKLLVVKSDDFSSELFFAKYQGRVLAAALVNFYRNYRSLTSIVKYGSQTSEHAVATYLHGASSRENKKVMPPHLLHWRIMLEVKRRGFQYYDFWGIDEKRWPGLTRFKKGFGGQVVEYPDSFDVVYRPFWYLIYQVGRKVI